MVATATTLVGPSQIPISAQDIQSILQRVSTATQQDHVTAGQSMGARISALPSEVQAAVKSGDYNAAWRLAASGNSDTVALLTDPRNLAAMGASGMSADQLKSFYTAALPYSELIANTPTQGGTAWGYGTSGGPGANVKETLQNLIKNPTANSAGGLPNIYSNAYHPSGGFFEHLGDAIPALTATALSLGTGVGVAGLLGGGIGGAAAGGAAANAVGSFASDAPITSGGLLRGAATGVLGAGAIKAIAPEVQSLTGLSSSVARDLTGAGLGAIKSAIGGKDPLAGAIAGGVGTAVAGGLKDYGASNNFSNFGGSLAGNLTGGLVTPKTSSGGGSTGASHSPGVPPVTSGAKVPTQTNQPGVMWAPAAGGSDSHVDFLGSLGTGVATSLGLDPNNLLGSLGTNVGEALPYAAVGAIGINQANKGRQQDQAYVDQMRALGQPYTDAGKQMLADAQGGKLNTTDQNVVNTSANQGKALVDSTKGLSQIAQSAFADYQAGKLPAADEQQLKNQIAAQKQQVRQQLSSAGITDSTILAGQDQQIDNQAKIMRQQLLDKRFATGNQAYDSWLTGTQAGQKTILDGQKFASSQLQNMMQTAFESAALGFGPMEGAIQMAMQTDAQYAAQVSSLLGTLTSAYAYQMAKKAGASGGGAGSGAGGGTGSGAAGAIKNLLPGGRQDNLDNNSVVNSPEHQQLLQQDSNLAGSFAPGTDYGNMLSLGTSGDLSLLGDSLAQSMDSPVGGWLSDYQLGG